MPVCCETTCCSDQPLVSACQDRQTREPRPVEGPCPLCGAIQEYWSDEILERDRLRCRDCGQRFDAASFRDLI